MRVNISRTFREASCSLVAPSFCVPFGSAPASAIALPQRFHRLQENLRRATQDALHRFLRHLAKGTSMAKPACQHKPQLPPARLLVRAHRLDNLLRLNIRPRRQRPHLAHQRHDSRHHIRGRPPTSCPSNAAHIIPHATASPCRKCRYCVTDSSACPNVCPKFKISLRPDSFSSLLTTRALIAIDRRIKCSRARASRRKTASICFSRNTKSFASAITPYLITSASPPRNSRSGNVPKSSGSASTNRGG